MLLGVLASAAMLIGKFLLEANPVMNVGLAALIAASVWNTWPLQKQSCCIESLQQMKNEQQIESKT